MSNQTERGVEIRTDIATLELGSATAADEFLHPPVESRHYSSTETSYFGFNIPDQTLTGEVYIWFHPILKVMSVSVYIWRGIVDATLQADYVNHFHYLPFPEGDIGNYTIADAGLRIVVIEPLGKIRVEYADDVRNVSFSLLSEAIMPPAVRPGGTPHFTQAMRTSGTLNLFGEVLTIDGFFTRDRSWSQERREASLLLPPVTWMAGVVDEDFAFHVAAFDSFDLWPEWQERYRLPADNLNWGYIFQDGRLLAVRSARKRTMRGNDGLVPTAFELELVDAEGVEHEIRGDIEGRIPWQTWQNVNVYFCLTRWSTQAGIGWGDCHEIQFNDFAHHFRKRDAMATAR